MESNYAFELFDDYGPDGVLTYKNDPERYQLRLIRNEKRQKRKQKQVTVTNIVLGLFCAVALVGMLIYVLSGFAHSYELDRAIANVESEIKDATSENVRLNNLLESKMSGAKVDDYATNVLGMVLVEDYQIEFINFSTDDKIITPYVSFKEKLANAFNIKE